VGDGAEASADGAALAEALKDPPHTAATAKAAATISQCVLLEWVVRAPNLERFK
jgi:hypothetical protein